MKTLNIKYTKSGIPVNRVKWNKYSLCYMGEIIVSKDLTKAGVWDKYGVFMGNRIYYKSNYDLKIPLSIELFMEKAMLKVKTLLSGSNS